MMVCYYCSFKPTISLITIKVGFVNIFKYHGCKMNTEGVISQYHRQYLHTIGKLDRIVRHNCFLVAANIYYTPSPITMLNT